MALEATMVAYAAIVLLCVAVFPNATLLVPVAVITVLSPMLLPADPPPDTITEFDSGVAAFDATFTVTVMGGKLNPPFSTLVVVQVGSTVQFHVAPPLIDTSVIPNGTLSVTVTVPLAGPAAKLFVTVTV